MYCSAVAPIPLEPFSWRQRCRPSLLLTSLSLGISAGDLVTTCRSGNKKGPLGDNLQPTGSITNKRLEEALSDKTTTPSFQCTSSQFMAGPSIVSLGVSKSTKGTRQDYVGMLGTLKAPYLKPLAHSGYKTSHQDQGQRAGRGQGPSLRQLCQRTSEDSGGGAG